MLSLEDNKLTFILSKLFVVVVVVSLLVGSIVYLNRRWGKIRDIRRRADAQSIAKALEFYNQQYNHYPYNSDNDGEGWDKSNDQDNRQFLEPLVSVGLLASIPFDPLNDGEHYYRYRRLEREEFGCPNNNAVFQVTQFETSRPSHVKGDCPRLNLQEQAPNGYTWQGVE